MSIANRIRKQLEQPDGLTMEALQPLALQFDAESRQVNERLNGCIRLLNKGLRSEAIQQAFMKPNILDWSASLDFPEFEEWVEILQFYGIQAPTLVDRQAASQLHEALVDAQPLEELLRQHRRLAIAKAPLSWRLKILRRLAAMDAMNVVWKEDQEQWETVRIKQLTGELTTASQARDATAVSLLCDELTQASWAIPIPENLVKSALQTRTRLEDERCIAQLDSLSAELHNAYGEGNEGKAKKLVQQWKAVCQQLATPIPTHLLEQTEPAMEWLSSLEEEKSIDQRRAELIGKLESLLQNQRTPLIDLRRAHYQLASLPREIPTLLDKQFRTRILELEASSRRRTAAIVSGVAGSLLLLVVSGFIWYQRTTFQQTVAKTNARLAELLAQDDLDQTEELITKLKQQSSSLANAPEIVSKMAEFETRKTTEIERREQALAAIEAADGEDALLDIEKILNAEKLATKADEKAKISSIRKRWDARERAIADTQFENVKRGIESIRQELTKLQSMKAASVDKSEIEELIQRSQKLLDENPRGGPEARSIVTLTTQSATQLRDSISKIQEDSRAREMLLSKMRSITSSVELRQGLKDFVDRLPNDELTTYLRKSYEESSLWEQTESWNRWALEISKAATDADLQESKILEFSDRYEENYRKLNIRLPESIEQYFSQSAERTRKRSSTLSSFAEEMKNSVMLELVTLINPENPDAPKAGERFFINLRTRDEFSSTFSKGRAIRSLTLPVVSDRSGAVSNIDFRGNVHLLDEPRMAVKRILLDVDGNPKKMIREWERQFQRVFFEVASAEDLDKQLKSMLIARLLSVAMEGSESLRDAYQNTNDYLFNRSEARAAWFAESPFDANLEPDLIRELKASSEKWNSSLGDRKKSLAEISKSKLVWVGSILPDTNGKLVAFFYRSDVPNGTLLTITTNGISTDRGELSLVGKVSNGEGQLNTIGSAVQAGRPLYWRNDSSAR